MKRRHNLFRHAALLLGALFLLLNTPLVQTAQAQDKGQETKVDGLLSGLTQTGKRAPSAIAGNDQLSAVEPTVQDGKVLIDAVASGSASSLAEDLRSMGMTKISTFGRVVSGWIPVSAIDGLEDVGSLQFARASMSTNRRVGSVTSGGDPAMRADLARDEFDVDGTGAVIGALSDSYDCLGGAAAGVASGDLPAGVIVLDDSACPGSDEGRAMMELAYDVAPGSNLAFHTAFGGQAGFANGIIELTTVAGANVSVDDVIYFAEPMFQDGIVAQAVDSVVALGTPHFSSAGNNARDAYESAFRGSGIAGVFGGERHDFDPGPGVDDLQAFTLAGGGAVTIFALNWDEPYASVSGAPGSSSDVDIILYLSGGIFIGLGGFDFNIGGDPIEVFGVVNNGADLVVDIGIELFSGPAPGFMKYVFFDSGGDSFVSEFDTASGSLYGHTNAAGSESIGAARYTETPVFGVDPPLIEFFSSAGPTPIFFDLAGNRLATPEVRLKPEVTGPDGGNTTFFFPGSLDLEGDGIPNFFGTSASAPHVAGVAALLIDQATEDDDDDDGYLAKGADDDDDDGGGGDDCGDDDDDDDCPLTPDEIYAALEASTIDMDDPATPGFDTGFDFGTGTGFVDACNALSGDDDDDGYAAKGADDDDDDGDACETDDDDDDGAFYKHVADAPDAEQATQTALLDNYPDPFNPETTIAFELVSSRAVQLNIYDVVGRRIATLVNGVLPSGRHEVRWEASNLPSGMYFYQLVTDDLVQVRPMMLVK